MRGILIDPFTRTVSEIEFNGGLAAIYELLGVECITSISVGQSDTLYLDDEGLMVPKDQQEYWQWPGSNQPYAGRGLILGADEDGDDTDATVTEEEVKGIVRFLDKTDIEPDEFLGFSIYTW